MSSNEQLSDIGLVGLAVMGQNLVLNMNDHGFKVSVFNRTVEKVDEFMKNEAKGTKIVGCHTLEELVKSLKKPRKVMVLVKAGAPVDGVLKQLVPLLEEGDIVIDGGNSDYTDTMRRGDELKREGKLYVGMGVSGGEEGARLGPSLMPGGDERAWPHIKDIFQSIAAKVGSEACCDWVGGGGSGHFVKMVHNGIEYADMQVVCESYLLLSRLLALPNHACAKIFSEWNEGELGSYLIELTRDILQTKDKDGKYVVDGIYDAAGQKGTGKWTVVASVKHQVPLNIIGEAVHARLVSSLKPLRVAISKIFRPPKIPEFNEKDREDFVQKLKKALYMAKIICYTQGYMLLKEASDSNGWNLNYGAIAHMWRGGCIIRSVFLGEIKKAYEEEAGLECLLSNHFFAAAVQRCVESLKAIVISCVDFEFPVPALSAALSFYQSYRVDIFPHSLFSSLYSKRPTILQDDQTPAGHFVKMVHEGVEYTRVQVLCESYLLLSRLLALSDPQCAQVYQDWMATDLHSPLLQTAINLLQSPLPDNQDSSFVEVGKEVMLVSLDYGAPFTTINAAVYSKFLKSLKRQQTTAEVKQVGSIDKDQIQKAVTMAMIVIYAQAFMLLKKASDTNGWNLKLAEIAEKWRNKESPHSCLLTSIKTAYEEDAELECVLTKRFSTQIESCVGSFSRVLASTWFNHTPTPTLSSSFSFYHAFRSEKLPHNLLQALRDYFGAHTYSTLDNPGVFVHTDWTGRGGRVTSTAYNS